LSDGIENLPPIGVLPQFSLVPLAEVEVVNGDNRPERDQVDGDGSEEENRPYLFVGHRIATHRYNSNSVHKKQQKREEEHDQSHRPIETMQPEWRIIHPQVKLPPLVLGGDEALEPDGVE